MKRHHGFRSRAPASRRRGCCEAKGGSPETEAMAPEPLGPSRCLPLLWALLCATAQDLEQKVPRSTSEGHATTSNSNANLNAYIQPVRPSGGVICGIVPYILESSLISDVTLRFFYGPRITNNEALSLRESPTLIQSTYWNKSLPIALYIFGWMHSTETSYTRDVIDVYTTRRTHNLVVLDWESTTKLPYGQAATALPAVGRAVALALQATLDWGAELDVIVGHDLGAHLAGHIGRNMRTAVPFIAALDPVGPLFYSSMFKCQEPVLASDAKYVMALHTDWGGLGGNEPVGKADFMANNGLRLQPGCSILDVDPLGPRCSHNRAISIWKDAVQLENSVMGRQCPWPSSFYKGSCSQNPVQSLTAIGNDTGFYVFSTKEFSPFGLGEKGADPPQ